MNELLPGNLKERRENGVTLLRQIEDPTLLLYPIQIEFSKNVNCLDPIKSDYKGPFSRVFMDRLMGFSKTVFCLQNIFIIETLRDGVWCLFPQTSLLQKQVIREYDLENYIFMLSRP